MSETWMLWTKRLSPETLGVLHLAQDVKAGRYPNTPIIGINYLRAVAELAETITDELRRTQDPAYWERKVADDKADEGLFTL